VNGRFESLGWAHSFTTVGEITFEVSWKAGEIGEIEPVIVSQEGRQ
jgi:hypothetical protein